MQNGPTTPRRVSMIPDASTPGRETANAQPYSPAPRLKIETPDQSSFPTELYQELFLNGHTLIARSFGARFGLEGFNPLEAYEALIYLKIQHELTLKNDIYNGLLCKAKAMFKTLPITAIGDFWFFQFHQMTKKITLDLISESSDIQKALQNSTLFDKQNTAILKDWERSPVYLRYNENWTISEPSPDLQYDYIDTFLACIINPDIRRSVAYYITQEGLFGLVRPWTVLVSREADKKLGRAYFLLQDQESSTIFLEVLPNGNIRLCLQIFQSYVTLGKHTLPIKSPLPLVLMFEICGRAGNIIFSKAHVMANDLLIGREHQGQMILQPMPELLRTIKSIW